MSVNIFAKLELELEKTIYRESYYEFFKAAFAQMHPNVPLDDNWHIKYLCDILQEETFRIVRREPKKKDIIINIPPRSLKSYISSIVWPVWSWTIDPSLKFASISYAGDIALEISRKSRNLINTHWFQRLYSSRVVLRKDVSGAGHYETVDGGVRKSVGINGAITGTGYDILLFDDPLSPQNANSEKELETAWFQFNETFFNRLNQAVIGLRVTIMQRLHEKDQTGRLMDPKNGNPEDHLHVCIPAEYDPNTVSPPELKEFYKDGLFSVNTFPKSLLETYKKRGALYYAGQYQQRPVPPEGNLFKKAWFEIIPANMVSRDPLKSPIHFFLDTAYTEKQENDPTGILACFKHNNDLYIINFTEVWYEFPKLVKFIPGYVHLHGYTSSSGIYVEPKASGKSIVQQLKDKTGLNIIEIESEMLKEDKLSKAAAISPIANAGRIKIIEGPWNDAFITQLCSFPKAAHDESIDTLTYAVDTLMPVNDFFYGFL